MDRMLTKAEATALRHELDRLGYIRTSGSGRGASWTRHEKDGRMVFVQKANGSDVYRTFQTEAR